MRSIILARVSTEEQDSNTAQVNRLKKYAEEMGFLKSKVYKIEESSTKAYRKKFQEIIGEIKRSKEPTALFVDTVDRLQRSFKESVVFDELRKEGVVELHFYRERLRIHEGSNSSDIMRWDMAVMFAKMYVLQLSDNVKRTFEQRREEGSWTGPAPFGYLNVALDKEKRLRKDIVIDPERAKIVLEIYEKYLTKEYSVRKIADELIARGIKTPEGKEMAQSKIHFILSNPFYYGVARSNKYGEYPHNYEPVISKEVWVSAQKIRNTRNRSPVKTTSKDYIFRGLLKCPKCGCSITAEMAKGKYVYYSCTNAKGICKREYTNENELLKTVRKIFKDIKLSDERINKIVAFLKKHHDHESKYHKREINNLRSKYDTFQIEVEKLLDLLIKEIITEKVYQKRLEGCKVQQEKIEIELEKLTQSDKNYHTTAQTVLSLAQRAEEIFESSETHEKRQLLGFIFQNLEIREKKLVFSLNSPFDVISDYCTKPLLRR